MVHLPRWILLAQWLKASVDIPDFDIVLNHGDLPLLRTCSSNRYESRFTDTNDENVRKTTGKPPFYGPMDKEAVSNAMDG